LSFCPFQAIKNPFQQWLKRACLARFSCICNAPAS
jgi:hypothetical protein